MATISKLYSARPWPHAQASTSEPAQPTVPEVLIIGGGFGGLRAALELRHASVHVTLIDRSNHHIFQPLLYQVATAMLSPADISGPIRGIVGHQANTDVVLAEVTGVNTERRLRLSHHCHGS
jgi:NADH:ubiquinone reductase (H+-translocating)